MTIDRNKSINAIVYNHLNLPLKISFANGGTISYFYNAIGQKVKKVVLENSMTNTTDYLNGYQYKNSGLQFFPTAEGYVNFTASGVQGVPGKFNYAFNYLDHLGNVRMTYSQDPVSLTLRIMEENHYYPFGLKHSGYNSDMLMYVKDAIGTRIKPVPPLFVTSYQYKYNGKELQDELGLNLYDLGARNYDPALGRWMNIDPMAEKFYPLSAYSYVANSPILLGDPNGEDWTITQNKDKEGRVHYQVTYTGAVLNSSSNKKIDMVSFAKSIVSQTEKLLTSFEKREDGSFDSAFTVDVQLRIVDDKKDVKDDESLIEIKDGSDKDFQTKSKNTGVLAKEVNGKEISVNADYVNDMISGKNKKTIPHELGHSLGLKHPLMDRSFFGIINGSTFNSPKSNFMYQGTVKSPTGPTREQINRIYQLYTNNQLNRKDIQPVNSDSD